MNVVVTESFVCLGAPIIMSSPHFYQADEKFVQDVFGMKPEKEYHQTAIDINPVRNLILILEDVCIICMHVVCNVIKLI